MKKLFTFSCLLLFISFTSFAQLKIGAPAGAPAASAILDISNTGAATNAKKGFLGPQVALSGTDDATTVPTPVAGLMVYNTNTSAAGATAVVAGYYYYNGTQWVQMVSSAAPASGNIYTADGTLAGNRAVTLAANSLNFNSTTGNLNFVSSGGGSAYFNSTGTAVPFTSINNINGLSRSIFQNNSAGVSSRTDLQIGANGNNIYFGVDNAAGASPYLDNRTGSRFAFQTMGAEQMTIATSGNVGIGNSTPNSTLQVGGSVSMPYSSVAAPTTLTNAQHYVYMSSGGTVTLPAALTGREYIIKAGNGNATKTTVSGGASSIFSGTGGGTATFDLLQGQSATFISDGSNWAVHALTNNYIPSSVNNAVGSTTVVVTPSMAVGTTYVYTFPGEGNYEITFGTYNGCAFTQTTKVLATVGGFNNQSKLNQIYCYESNGDVATVAQSANTVGTPKTKLVITFPTSPGCGDGGNATTLDVTAILQQSASGATPTFTLTNNANIGPKVYTISILRVL